MSNQPAMNRSHRGQPLQPGWNVDEVDLPRGLEMATRFGYDSGEHLMVVEYALTRHARGEEDGAQRSALSGGIDLTSWYAILAAALTPGVQDARRRAEFADALS